MDVLLEVAQAFIPERHAEIRDLLWDAIGIGIGLGQACYRIYVRIRQNRMNKDV